MRRLTIPILAATSIVPAAIPGAPVPSPEEMAATTAESLRQLFGLILAELRDGNGDYGADSPLYLPALVLVARGVIRGEVADDGGIRLSLRGL